MRTKRLRVERLAPLEHREDGVGHCLRILDRHEPADLVGHDVLRAATARRDDRRPAREGLYEHHPEALGAAREDEHVALVNRAYELVERLGTREMDDLVDPELDGQLAQTVPI